MSFTTLAERFEATSKDIYSRYAAKTDTERQPYVSIVPNTVESQSRIKDDNRALPFISTQRDVKRISQFLKSSDGRFFLAKQALLQTGNTFVTTKLYNPASPLLNAIPFVHARRHITTTGTVTPSASGLLQNNTVTDISSKFIISGKLQALNTSRRSLVPTALSIAGTYLSAQLKKVANTVIPIPQTYNDSRPEYKIFYDGKYSGPMVFPPQPIDQRGTQRLNLNASVKNAIRTTAITVAASALNRLLPKSIRNKASIITKPLSEQNANIPTFVEAATQFRKTFKDRNGRTVSRISSKYFSETTNGFSDPTNPSIGTEGLAQSTKTELKDLINIPKTSIGVDSNKVNYDNIFTKSEADAVPDIIKFRFTTEDNKFVQFRALISSIKESVKPEFNDQRYVGRTERFVTYAGAKRSVALTFNIVAFSSNEADGMWSRVNYLTGLAFPKGVTNGFMVPPLFKLTLGGIYDMQPCYIEVLDYDYLDETITFDTDKEIPFAINVTMQLSLLEKRSRFYDSPFYKVTENLVSNQFDNTLLNVSSQIDENIANRAIRNTQQLGRIV